MGPKLALSVHREAFATAISVAVLVGCSGGQLGGPGGGPAGGNSGAGASAGEPLDIFASDFQTAFCLPRVACGVFPDLATCEAFYDFADGYDVRNIIASARRGTVTYDPVQAAECIADLPQDCSATTPETSIGSLSYTGAAEFALQTISACISTFTGTVPLGGDCRFFDFECAAPNLCDMGTVNNGCTGTCGSASPNLAPGVPGDDCTQSGWCLLPALCNNGICITPPGHLASCASAPCEYLDDYCGLAPGATTPTCLPRVGAGAPCALGDANLGPTFDPCVLDSQCIDGVCAPAYPPLGGSCGVCLKGITCTNGICSVMPTMDFCPIPM